MFITETKTAFLTAIRQTFNADYPEADFRGVWAGMEYPEDKTNYPGIWVDFNPTAPVQAAGIGHVEYTAANDAGHVRKATRWRFSGQASFTVMALSSLERDRLTDELLRVIAFGLEDPGTAPFRNYLTANDLIMLSVQWDQISLEGKSENPGTPWGSGEVVYEITAVLDCQGEFLSSAASQALVPLSGITFTGYGPDDGTPPSLSGWL